MDDLISTPASEQLSRFASAIFDPDDIVEVRRLPSGASTWHRADELADHVEAFAKDNETNHIFFGANPRTAQGQTKSVAYAHCLFTDFDHDTTPPEALERIEQSGLPRPTVVINSGHGVHAYWRLSERIDNLQEWTQYQKRLIRLLGSDKAIHDAPRLMRLPGFTNIKAPVAQCDLVECEPERIYDIDELVAKLPEPQHRPEPSEQKTLENKDFSSTCDTLARAARYAAKWPPAEVGERHGTAFRHAAQLRHDFGLSADAALPLLAAWNETNTEPLPQTEIAKCLRDAGQYGGKPEHVKPKPSICDTPKPASFTIAELCNRAEYADGLQPVTTGFDGLNEALGGGFRPSNIYIIGARTGYAKSTLAINIVRAVALDGVPVLLLKLEESAIEAVWRIHASVARVPLNILLNGGRFASAADRQSLAEGYGTIRDLPIRVSENRQLGAIVRIVTEHVRNGLAKLIVIDQLSGIDVEAGSAFERMSIVSNTTRDLAVDLKVPIVCVHQVNREGAKSRVNKKGEPPRRLDAFDLRDSGTIENDSAGVLLIDATRPPDSGDKSGPWTLEILLAKSRYSARTRPQDPPLELLWWPATCRIEDQVYAGQDLWPK